ncbi:hypothetical protein PN441_15985 [Spirulina major CS-329]|uniref:hypothetical protein n=1 Tax=Spirulina TaxID=1154 RepID=UPI00232D8968|nr:MULTISPECIES: hypothetical protein [Spirulina]MDB9493890.1 hypothetical protein [Spirulina subsalsa CS-330]MDB9504578.1 hypothetical protein [Spirulina major CS-329]
MKTTKLNVDFMAHREQCNIQTYQAVHGKPYSDQINYDREQIAQSRLAQLWQSLNHNA